MKRTKFRFNHQTYQISETATSYVLMTPALFLMAVLFFIPLAQVFGMSFTNMNLIRGTQEYNGLANYEFLLTAQRFWQATANTSIYSVIKISVGLFLAVATALMLDMKIPLRKLIRIIYFAPVVVSVVASSMIWLWFYDPGIGPLNQILKAVGLPPLKWLYDAKTSLISITIFSIWHGVGYNVVILLAGLQSISDTYIEAARVEGASEFQMVRYIKLPLLAPTFSFVLMMDIISSFKSFTDVNVMTPTGGPNYSTGMIVNYIYEQAFTNSRMGRGSAASILLFLIILVLTLLQKRIERRKAEG